MCLTLLLETCAGSICCLSSASNVLALIITYETIITIRIIIIIITIIIEELSIAKNYLPKFRLQGHLSPCFSSLFISCHFISFHFLLQSVEPRLSALFGYQNLFPWYSPVFFMNILIKIRCDLDIVLYNFFIIIFL